MFKFTSNIRTLTREIFYHKIQYSKVYKFDIVAALMGITLSTVISVLLLSTFGTCSVDLSDLTVLIYYVVLIYVIFSNIKFLKLTFLKNILNVIFYIFK